MYKVYFGKRSITLGEAVPSPDMRGEATVIQMKDRAQLGEVVTHFRESGVPDRLHVVHADAEKLFGEMKSLFLSIQAGGGLVRNAGGQYLLILRNGVWDLPKGKLEKGESFGEAALREVEEETGLAGLELSQLLVSTYHTYTLNGREVLKETRWYEMHYSGDARPVLQGEEGITDWAWLEPGKASRLPGEIWPAVKDVLRIKSVL